MPSDKPLINAEALDSLRELGGEEFVVEIIGIFTEDTPTRIKELHTSFAASDTGAFVRAAHSIKGSSSNLGAENLRTLAETLEQDAKRDGLAGLGARIAEIEESFQRTVEALANR